MNWSGDPGLEVLQFVYTSMQIDEAWSVREPRRFTWWGHRLAQRVWAEPPRASEGFEVSRVHAETDLLQRVSAQPDLLDRLAVLNRFASLSALVWDPQRWRLTLRCSVYVHRQSLPWVRQLFAAAVAIQAADAHIKVAELPRFLGGEPDVSAHPASGWRHQPDDMLEVIARVFAPQGRGPSPFTEADFKTALRMQPRPWVLATGNGAGMAAEFPFRGDVPAVAGGSGTALFTASARERHPQLGSGALLLLSLPSPPDPGPAKSGESARLANELNLAEPESWTGAHFLGAWATDPGRGLTFTTFLPAAVYRRGLLDAMILSSAMRARWASDHLAARR
jgi:hypothetical protein